MIDSKAMDLNDEALRRYEIMFLVRSESNSIVKKILEANGAKILSEKPLEKVRLFYPIKKQTFAFAGSFAFEIHPQKLEKLSKDLGLENEVLRSMLTSSRVRGERAFSQNVSREAAFERKRSAASARVGRKYADTILTNEALEKKIEEILQ